MTEADSKAASVSLSMRIRYSMVLLSRPKHIVIFFGVTTIFLAIVHDIHAANSYSASTLNYVQTEQTPWIVSINQPQTLVKSFIKLNFFHENIMALI